MLVIAIRKPCKHQPGYEASVNFNPLEITFDHPYHPTTYVHVA